MNENVKRLIDRLFENTVDTEEMRSLREEVENNCQEHFTDLLGQGKSEEEALLILRESLTGLEEMIGQCALPAANAAPEGKTAGAQPSRPEEEAGRKLPPASEENSAPQEKSEWEFSAEEVRELDAQTEAASFRLIPTPGSRVRVTCEPSCFMQCYVLNGTLHIIYDSKKARLHKKQQQKLPREGEHATFMDVVQTFLNNLNVNISLNAPVISVYIPDDPERVLNVSSVSGDITVQGSLTAKVLSLHSTGGDIRAEGCLIADTFKANTVGGDISADSRIRANDLELRTISGDIRAVPEARNAVLSSTSGDISAEADCGQVTLRTVSGDLLLTGRSRTITAGTTSGDLQFILSDTPGRTEARSISGDVLIRCGGDRSSVHTGCSTVSGDVHVSLEDAGPSAVSQISVTTVSGDIRVE